MIKHELEYIIEATLEGMDGDIKSLAEELANLDPSVAYMACMKLAKIKGTYVFLKKRLKEYQSES